jgi:hypothetical protein
MHSNVQIQRQTTAPINAILPAQTMTLALALSPRPDVQGLQKAVLRQIQTPLAFVTKMVCGTVNAQDVHLHAPIAARHFV